MDKVFEIRICKSGLGRYNATQISTICVVCDNYDEAINHIFTRDTISVELISVKPCLILSKNG